MGFELEVDSGGLVETETEIDSWGLAEVARQWRFGRLRLK